MNSKHYFLILLLALFCQEAITQINTERDFNSYFATHGIEGCFVLFDETDNEYIKYNSSLCDTGYLPASTFKIPNSLIALEENVVSDTNDIIKWNGHEWPHAVWNKDQTLKTAFQYSCIWVYFEFAEQVGIEKYHHYLEKFNYGNKNLSGPPNHFWLEGSFKISANQQVEFLRNFYNHKLEISERSTSIIKNIMVLEQTPSYKISGKTGGTKINENEYIMWLVGYVEAANKTYFYALNFKANNFNKTKNARFEITKSILEELGII